MACAGPVWYSGGMIFPGVDMPERTAAERKRKREAYEQWAAAERERARRQRTYLTSLKGSLRDALIVKMLERAWELLDANEAEACDALLEFVPEEMADAMLDEYFRDELESIPPRAAVQPARRMRCVGDPQEPHVLPPSLKAWRARRDSHVH